MRERASKWVSTTEHASEVGNGEQVNEWAAPADGWASASGPLHDMHNIHICKGIWGLWVSRDIAADFPEAMESFSLQKLWDFLFIAKND